MIWAAMFYGLYMMFGGGSLSVTGEWFLKQVQPNVISEIQDKERSKSVKNAFKEMSGELKKFNKHSKSIAKEFQKLIRDYSSTSEDFKTLQEQDRVHIEEYVNHVLDRLSNLKSFIKKEEWEAATGLTQKRSAK